MVKVTTTTKIVTHTVTTHTLRPSIVDLVRQTVDNMSYNRYQLGGTRFDLLKGVYIVDCSSFVDHLLAKVNRPAYKSIVHSSGTPSPNTRNYYNFFNQLNDKKNHYWNKVESVNDLRAGDIVVFRQKYSDDPTGHIMVVMKKPVKKREGFQVQVADSAPFRHSKDTRAIHKTGIGVGTLLLKVNPKTGKPLAYAWSVGSYWKSNINFAMARPVYVNS